MASHNNYYGYGGSVNQYSAAAAPGVYNATTGYTPAVSQQVYNVSQPQTQQYGAYGNRVQAYEDTTSYYTQQASSSSSGVASSALPSSSAYNTATYSSGYGSTGGDSSYSSLDKYQTASKNTFYQTPVAGGDSSFTPAYQTQQPSKQPSTASSSSYKNIDSRAGGWSNGSVATGDKKISQWQPTSSSSSRFEVASSASSTTAGYASNLASDSTIQLTGLDKALITIATNYVQSQNQRRPVGFNQRANWLSKKGKLPTDPSQWIMCELCKMTCPGQPAYKLHLEGKTHKKKEAAAAAAGGAKTTATQFAASSSKNKGSYCSVCDVACSCQDAYAAHIRGIKHQKVVKLMQRLGKPIPEDNIPVSPAVQASSSASGGLGNSKASTASAALKKVVCTPRINFVGGTQLKSTGAQLEEVAMASIKTEPGTGFIGPVIDESESGGDDGDFFDADVQPVGLEYLEEGMNDAGTAPSFYCKLCNCHFTDVMAKVMHTKGRRHRIQYKKKVDPTLKVEMKANPHDRRLMHRNKSGPEMWRKREMQVTFKLEAEELRYEKEYLEWKLLEASGARYIAPPAYCWRSCGNSLMLETQFFDDLDRCIQLKHKEIYPTEQELAAVQLMVAACEKALKLVSDGMATSVASEAGEPPVRKLKGVMRVGLLSKGLLLHDNLNLHLVVLCSNKPTNSLVKEIADKLPDHFEAEVAVEVQVLDSEIVVVFTTAADQPKVSCIISLTSPAVKDDDSVPESSREPDPDDMLNRDKCLQLLAELRHAKWFQARVSPQASSLIVIRLMMDLCRRYSAWRPLSQWALELLVEKAISSAGIGVKVTPSDALIRVLQCVSSGILLEGEPGLFDVCEKDPTDAASCLSRESREAITASAQYFLRRLVLGMAHKVFDLQTPFESALGGGSGATQRKRPRMASN